MVDKLCVNHISEPHANAAMFQKVYTHELYHSILIVGLTLSAPGWLNSHQTHSVIFCGSVAKLATQICCPVNSLAAAPSICAVTAASTASNTDACVTMSTSACLLYVFFQQGVLVYPMNAQHFYSGREGCVAVTTKHLQCPIHLVDIMSSHEVMTSDEDVIPLYWTLSVRR